MNSRLRPVPRHDVDRRRDGCVIARHATIHDHIQIGTIFDQADIAGLRVFRFFRTPAQSGQFLQLTTVFQGILVHGPAICTQGGQARTGNDSSPIIPSPNRATFTLFWRSL